MATLNPTITRPAGDDSVQMMVFTPMTFSGTDVTAPIPFAQWADRSVQVFGTFGAGGSVRIEGSNDGGTTYAVLNDPSSTALNMTAAGLEEIMEICGLVRARVTAGDGSTSLTVAFCLRRQQQLRT
jgi:hypothetical protein